MENKIMRIGLLTIITVYCIGCTSVSRVMGIEKAGIAVTYYAPAWGPGTNGEEVVYFLKQVTLKSESQERTRIYFCSVKPDGTQRKEIAWLWKDQPDQFLENYATAATMEVNAATKRAAIGVEQGQRGGIFVVNLDGKGFRSVWPKEWNEDRPTTVGYPTWSPDGQWLAFHEYRFEKGFNYYRIAKMQPDSTGYSPLTERNAVDMQPAWSPTGDLIAYISDRIANVERNIHAVNLWLMKPNGTEKRDTKQWGHRPCWSLDGKMVLLEGATLVDPASGQKIRDWNGSWTAYPKWGRSGFVCVGRLDVSISDPEGKASRRLLKNVFRKGVASDIEKEGFRW